MRRVLLAACALLLTGAGLWLAMLWPRTVEGAPLPGRIAVVAGVSVYDAGMRIADTPQFEEAARELAGRLQKLPGTEGLEVRRRLHRVTCAELLGDIKQAAGRLAASPGGGRLLVAVASAGGPDGLRLSDGKVTEKALREALEPRAPRVTVWLLDSPQSGDLRPESRSEAWAVVTSSEVGQGAWPLFVPDDNGALRFTSAAMDGWARAMESTTQGLRGDLGAKGTLSVEDLALMSEQETAAAVQDDDASRQLDPAVAAVFLHAVSPPLLHMLDRGRMVDIKDLRDRWGERNFELFGDDLWSLSDQEFRQQGADVKQKLSRALEDVHGSEALRQLHRDLRRRNLLASPPTQDDRNWKWLRSRGGSRDRIELVLAPRQEVRVRGGRALAVTGPAQDCSWPVAYGTWSGSAEELPHLELRLKVFGTWLTGTWEGEIDGRRAKGQLLGRYDPVRRRADGQIVGKVRKDRSYHDLGALFEASFSKDGRTVRGTWKSRTPLLPGVSHWKLVK